MRVALISEHASPLAVLGGDDAGGQNVHVASLALALGRLGAHVVVYTRRDAPHLRRRVRLGPSVWVEHVDAGPPAPVPKDELWVHMPEFAAQLRADWSRVPPDVAHAHFWMSGWASLEAATPLGIPTLQTFHALGTVKRRQQGSKDTSPSERCAVEADITRRTDVVLAESNEEVFELVREGGDPRRLWVVPSGVDLDVFGPDGPSEPRGRSRHRIVVVTRLVERKGVGNVISALADVPDTELVIAGGPAADELETAPEAQRLRALAARAGVADRVQLRGRIDHDAVAALYRSADVVVCVPWYEPFGLVALEAMACGVPVVASAVGGLVDTVVDGATGLMVPPRQPDVLALALRQLLADEPRRRAFGAAGARRARSRYGWSTIASETYRAYQFVAAQRRAARLAAHVG
jgi:glycosyltransferase involved in cell wall biosynthesis